LSDWDAEESFQAGADEMDQLYAQVLKTGIIPGMVTR
jgi:hypothetical protein